MRMTKVRTIAERCRDNKNAAKTSHTIDNLDRKVVEILRAELAAAALALRVVAVAGASAALALGVVSDRATVAQRLGHQEFQSLAAKRARDRQTALST